MNCVYCGALEAVVLVEDLEGFVTPICEKCLAELEESQAKGENLL